MNPQRTPVDTSLIATILFLFLAYLSLNLFADSLAIKIILIIVALRVGIAIRQQREPPMPKDTNKLFVRIKNRSPWYFPAIIIVAIPYFYFTGKDDLSFTIVLLFLILTVQWIMDKIFAESAHFGYIIVDGHGVLSRQPWLDDINFNNVKRAGLRTDRLILYERWQHHTIFPSDYADGDRLQQILLDHLKRYKVPIERKYTSDVEEVSQARRTEQL